MVRVGPGTHLPPMVLLTPWPAGLSLQNMVPPSWARLCPSLPTQLFATPINNAGKQDPPV